MKLKEYIKNYDLLANAFGYWPSFHDGEITRFTLDIFEKEEEGYTCPFIEFTIHCWEMTSKVKNGYFVLKKHHLVKFHFEDVYDVAIEGYNHQNAVLSLEFEVLQTNERGFTPILIEIDPAYGLGGEFKAFSASVVSVFPCDKKGNKT